MQVLVVVIEIIYFFLILPFPVQVEQKKKTGLNKKASKSTLRGVSDNTLKEGNVSTWTESIYYI